MWWKILGAALFIYVLIGGMITPLRPGIWEVSPSQIKRGALQQVVITGYNTKFASCTNEVYLKLSDEQYLKAQDLKVTSSNELVASFGIPASLESKAYTLIASGSCYGYALLPEGVFVLNTQGGDSTLQAQILPKSAANFNVQGGLQFPFRNILHETIRNTFFHVALWMAMFVLYLVAIYYAIRYLLTRDLTYDIKSAAFNKSGILYGILGIITGSVWARFTWGTWWTDDVKLNMTTIAMFIYFGYLILRASFDSDHDKRARLSAVFCIFAFVALIPLVFVIPRMQDSLHPGNGGNPALGGEDLDNTLRLFFYPSIIALILLGTWMAQLKYRYDILFKKKNEI